MSVREQEDRDRKERESISLTEFIEIDMTMSGLRNKVGDWIQMKDGSAVILQQKQKHEEKVEKRLNENLKI